MNEYTVTWIDKDGAEHSNWVPASSMREARQLISALDECARVTGCYLNY